MFLSKVFFLDFYREKINLFVFAIRSKTTPRVVGPDNKNINSGPLYMFIYEFYIPLSSYLFGKHQAAIPHRFLKNKQNCYTVRNGGLTKFVNRLLTYFKYRFYKGFVVLVL